jgi:uncharacterized glyoxalase superfamily protein PhnB
MTQILFPALRYKDAPAAIDWLGRAFGFERHFVVEGEDSLIAHAQLVHEGAMIILGSEAAPGEDRLEYPAGAACVYLVVADPDAHHERAVAAGAEIVRPLNDTDYGSREYVARDPEGHLWSFGTYQPWDEGA